MDTMQRFVELVLKFEQSLNRKLTNQEKEFLMWVVKKEKQIEA
ncbi:MULTISPECIES: hypothetical protein [Priestia]|jgi:hypothetical protein|nr:MULTISPECIES: hypothetical protein [Priestia]MCU7764623.1 hypothetical protein [Priestia megaterium]MDH2453183.1 hypothetical protein [Priestia megaterium]MDL5152640.1 hypothetical protein [Priestia megaterium]MDP9722945.1 hypothetical protein [Priestia aryabhattai]MED3852569.1 hypothetical protein [Priestia megaterium]